MWGNKSKQGFTLLEILLVIGIIATLAVIVIVALDPAKRFEDARNSRRLSDIQSILSAVQQYIVDNRSALPPGLDLTERQLGTAASGCEVFSNVCDISSSGCLNLSSSLEKYLKEMPYDPQNGSSEKTRYAISINSNNIMTVKACDSTDSEIDSISR